MYTHVLFEQTGVPFYLILAPLVKFKSFLGFEAVSFGDCVPLGTASYLRIILALSIICTSPVLCDEVCVNVYGQNILCFI